MVAEPYNSWTRLTLMQSGKVLKTDVNPQNEIFEEGDFIRCCLVDVKQEILHATTDIEELKSIDSLLALKVSLGGVEKKEFPVHANYVSIVTTVTIND